MVPIEKPEMILNLIKHIMFINEPCLTCKMKQLKLYQQPFHREKDVFVVVLLTVFKMLHS